MVVEEPQEPDIPVTILTGFLGAGKTTLLNRILSENHKYKIAVIENEFGPENIDNDLIVNTDKEQIVSMNNGCVCCTIRGDLSRVLTDLRHKRDRGEIGFDYVVLETSGVANPGPVAQTFFMDDAVAPFFRLAGFKRAIALYMLHVGLAGIKIRQKSHKNHLIFRINRSRRCVSAARSASGARASAASTCRSASA